MIFLRPGEELVINLSREGVTQGKPLSVVLYGITLVPLVEELFVAAPYFLAALYAYDSRLYGLTNRSARLMILLQE